MTATPTDSHSARTVTCTGTVPPISTDEVLRNCSASDDSPLPTRACTGTCTRVLWLGPASTGVVFCTIRRGSFGVAMSSSETGHGRSFRTEKVSGALVAASVMSLGGTTATASSVCCVCVRCADRAAAAWVGCESHPLPSNCRIDARSGAVITAGSVRIVAKLVSSSSPASRPERSAARVAVPVSAASPTIETVAGLPEVSALRLLAVRPARCVPCTTAARSPTVETPAGRSSTTSTGAVGSAATARAAKADASASASARVIATSLVAAVVSAREASTS